VTYLDKRTPVANNGCSYCAINLESLQICFDVPGGAGCLTRLYFLANHRQLSQSIAFPQRLIELLAFNHLSSTSPISTRLDDMSILEC